MDSQDTKWHRNIAENCNRLSRAHERYRRHTDDRQTTDGRPMTYSERELEFTFANKTKPDVFVIYTCRFLRKFSQNRTTRGWVITWFFRWRPMVVEIYFRFYFWWHSFLQMAHIYLHTKFSGDISICSWVIINYLLCVSVPNFVKIGPSAAELWRHFDFYVAPPGGGNLLPVFILVA